MNNICSKNEIEQIIVLERLSLYNRGLPSGAKAIRKQLERLNVLPLPSVTVIGRALNKHGLTRGRTGWYDGENGMAEKTML